MALPLKVQTFNAFLGAQEGIHSIILPDIFSSGGSLNLWIDKFGRAKKISGYAKQNASAVTTDTGASATLLRGLFLHRASSSGAFARTLLGVFDDGTNECEVWKSANNGATWTFVQDLGSGSVGSIPDFAQIGSVLIFTNGVVAPRSFDGTTWATAGGTQLAAPTISAASGSGTLTGHYNWRVVPIIGGTADIHTRKLSSGTSNEQSVNAKQVSIAWSADADTSVTGYEIYRTTGTGKVYYNVGYVDGRTTVAFTDNISDLTLLENRVLGEHGDPPPTGIYHVVAHKQRMWYLRTDAFPQTGWWSDDGDPDGVYPENFITFADAETLGDTIVGGVGDYEGQLVVFEERSIWTISGTGEIIGDIQDWSRTRTNAQTGAVAKRAIARVPAGSRYLDAEGNRQTTPTVTLAYFTPLGDIRLFDGDNDIIISHPQRDTVAAFNYTHRKKIFCIPDTARSEITWVFPSGSETEPSEAVTWNYRWGVWYPRQWAFACGVEVETSSDASVLLAGSPSTTTGGYCYLLWSGNSADGSAFAAKWMTKTLYGVNEEAQSELSRRKRWRWADFLFETEQTATLTVEWLEGNASDDASAIGSLTLAPAALAITSSDAEAITASGGEALIVNEATTQLQALLHDSAGEYLHDEGIRLRIGDTDANGSWSLEGMTLAYQILPGLRRRLQG